VIAHTDVRASARLQTCTASGETSMPTTSWPVPASRAHAAGATANVEHAPAYQPIASCSTWPLVVGAEVRIVQDANVDVPIVSLDDLKTWTPLELVHQVTAHRVFVILEHVMIPI